MTLYEVWRYIKMKVVFKTMNLKEIRKKCGYTQTDLAKLIGISQQQYSRYETNMNKIPLETFLKVLEACHYKIHLIKKKSI